VQLPGRAGPGHIPASFFEKPVVVVGRRPWIIVASAGCGSGNVTLMLPQFCTRVSKPSAGAEV